MRKPPPFHSRGNRQGFTLTEILVTLGITAVLIAALLPIYSKATLASGGAACTQNLRTLAHAHTLYRQEHTNFFTSSRWDNPSTDRHNPGLQDYLGLTGSETKDTVMSCPLIQRGPSPSRRPMHMNYSINTTATYQYHINSRNVATKITDPSKYLLFTEGVVNPVLGSQQREAYNYFVAISWSQKEMQQFIHQGKQNVVFLDGHVAMLKPADFPEGKNAYKELLWWGSSY